MSYCSVCRTEVPNVSDPRHHVCTGTAKTGFTVSNVADADAAHAAWEVTEVARLKALGGQDPLAK